LPENVSEEELNEYLVALAYNDNVNKKLMILTGVELLRRFAMHILPHGFCKDTLLWYSDECLPGASQIPEKQTGYYPTYRNQRATLVRLSGYDPCKYQRCKC